MVASDPVIDRFGPRSTPIKSESTTPADGFAWAMAELAIRPAGRLFVRLLPRARATPAMPAVERPP